MQSYNIINPKAAEAYLKDMAAGDERLFTLLKASLGKALLKVDSAIKDVKTLPEDAPDWLRQKWDTQSAWHMFEPKGNAEIEAHTRVVLNWLKESIANNEAWLTMSVENGVPKKLRNIGTMGHILALTNKTGQATQSRKLHQIYNDCAENPLTKDAYKKLAHGFYVVHLSTPQDLKDESASLGHCIGSGDHDQKLLDGESLFYSIRDHTGKPHVTLEVDAKTGVVIEAQGKQVAVPLAKYMPYIMQFVNDANITLSPIPHATGILQQGGKYYSMYVLPDGLSHEGDLDFSRVKNARMPKDLKINGNLILNGAEHTSVPQGIDVTRDVFYLWRDNENRHDRDGAPALIKVDPRTNRTLREVSYTEGVNHGPDRAYDRATGIMIEENIYDMGVRKAYTARDAITGKITENYTFANGQAIKAEPIPTSGATPPSVLRA